MRILKVLPGAGGGFLPEGGLRDQQLVAELRWAGHDVLLVPLLLPIPGASGAQSSAVPLFYGAVRIFLEHRFPMFRRSPERLRRWLDSPRVLRCAPHLPGRASGAARAALTLSILRGEQGGQAGDLAALCAWLEGQPRPDVVHLSSVLLLGLARQLGKTLQAPVVCSVQDEEAWVDALPMPVAKRIWAEIRTRVSDAAGFIVPSHHAARRTPRRMGMPLRSLRVVHPGLELPPPPAAPERSAAPVWGVLLDPDDRPSLVRVCAAFQALRRRPDCASLKLRIAGPAPTPGMLADIAARSFGRDIAFAARGVRRAELPGFLRGISVLTLLPRVEPAFAPELLDAMARGVALVQPSSGANPEILELAEGGVLFDPGVPGSLEQALAGLVTDPERRAVLARRGRHGVALQFSLARMARETLEVYQAVCEGRRGEHGSGQGRVP